MMFSITVSPFVLSKSADCFDTIFKLLPFIPSSNPLPLSLVADDPAIPSSSTMFPLLPNLSIKNLAAISPPAMLSDAI